MHFLNKPTITTGLRGVPPATGDDASHPTRTTPAPPTSAVVIVYGKFFRGQPTGLVVASK